MTDRITQLEAEIAESCAILSELDAAVYAGDLSEDEAREHVEFAMAKLAKDEEELHALRR